MDGDPHVFQRRFSATEVAALGRQAALHHEHFLIERSGTTDAARCSSAYRLVKYLHIASLRQRVTFQGGPAHFASAPLPRLDDATQAEQLASDIVFLWRRARTYTPPGDTKLKRFTVL